MTLGNRSAKNLSAPLTLLFLVSVIVISASALAQAPTNGEPAADPDTEQETTEDPYGRDHPRGAFAGYIEAVSVRNYQRAAEYLDLSHVPSDRRMAMGPELARTLQRALDRGGIVPPAVMISDDPAGRRDDNLDPYLDRIGVIRIGQREVDVLVEQQERDGRMIWLVSSRTLQALPALIREQKRFEIDSFIPQALAEVTWQGVSVGHWVAVIVLAGLAYLLSHILVAVGVALLRLLMRRRLTEYGEGVLVAFVLPVRIYVAVWILVFTVRYLGIAIVVRQYFGELLVVVGWVASLLVLWRLVSLVSEIAQRQIMRRNNIGALSALQFFRRSAKIVVLVMGAIMVLDTLGFNVTTGLAALGIGGLAVALGAQKTIENLVGSLTLIFDQPVRVGDYCVVGDTSGVVEQIGMRSSRVRTLDRSIVVIPNSEFAAQRIENFAHRDRFRFAPTLNLRYETTPDQIRWLLVELRSLLYAHPKVDPDPARVRFTGLSENALQLEIFSYVLAKDFDEFLEVQEDLNLRIMQVVAESGSGFALKSQAVYLIQGPELGQEQQAKVEAQVQEWQVNGALDIPKFDPRRITELRGSIIYPPEGSSAAKLRR